MVGVLPRRYRVGLGALALAFILSIIAPVAVLIKEDSLVETAYAHDGGGVGLKWGSNLTPWYGYASITNTHWGYTFPGIDGYHRTLTIKDHSWTNDAYAFVRLHISKPNENKSGCLLIWDSKHSWFAWKICGPDKWSVGTWVMVAVGAGILGWWLVGPTIAVVPVALLF